MEFDFGQISSVVAIILGFFGISKYMVNNLKKTFITGKRMDAKILESETAMNKTNDLKFANLQTVTEIVTKIDIYFNGGKKK